LRRKKEKKDENDEEEEKKKEEMKRQVLGDDIPICAMRFELKNVKMRIPKVPHQIFGRLMAKDDYFPTAIATFDFQVNRSHLMNKMKEESNRKKGKKEKELPETLRIPLYSSWKVKDGDSKEEKNIKLGTLTLRLMGYVAETKTAKSEAGTPSAKSGRNAATPSAQSEGGEGEEDAAEQEGSEDAGKSDSKEKTSPREKKPEPESSSAASSSEASESDSD